MSAGSWAAWLALSAAAFGFSYWHYTRRETPGRGRALLAALRAGAFAVLLLLLFDPHLPARDGVTRSGTRVLLDASLSMGLPSGTGTATRWEQAAQRARSQSGDGPVLLFGDAVRAARAELPDSAPGDGRSLLLPALQAAAEGGARRVVVITDGGIEDADAVGRWAARLGLQIETEIVGAELANRSLAEVSAPTWVEGGQPARIEFAVSGTAGDSVRVLARRGSRVIGRTAVAAAGPGRLATGSIEVRLDAPGGAGWVPIELELEGGDDVADDDRRAVYVQVSAEPAGIALVSLRPDWEPRFLAPVLAQALGLPLHAFLRGGEGQYIRLAGGLDAGQSVTEAEVRRAVDRAELLVLHGLGGDAPAWAADAARAARRLLVFPADGASAALPLEPGAEQEGDFFLSSDVPPSPVAPLLTDLAAAGLPPLASLRSMTLPAGAWAPLTVTRGRQGAALPLAVAGAEGDRRWVMALGSGYWQWAFRGDAERQVYARLWSALAGWLARERGTAALAAVRPARLAVPRGAPVPWVTSGIAVDSLAVSLTGADGTVRDTVVHAAGDTLRTVAPPPGAWTWSARAFAGTDVIEADGVLTVEHYSPELARPRADLSALDGGVSTVRGAGRAAGAGRPLHATALPYVLLLLLLAGEWILRRRWGLR